jgi:hypothetical protein
VYRAPDEICSFHAIARELSKLTYQEKVLGSGLPADDEFRQRMLALAESDSVRAYTLHVDGKAVAYLYTPVRDGVVYYNYLGFDPNYSALSPGTVLQYLAMEDLFKERRFLIFDFEEGEGQHKRLFGTRKVDCRNLLVFRLSVKALAFIVFDFIALTATRFALIMLDKFSLRTKVRNLYR